MQIATAGAFSWGGSGEFIIELLTTIPKEIFINQ
jgi:hypothetical protein